MADYESLKQQINSENMHKAAQSSYAGCLGSAMACRERTVGEELEARIEGFESRARALRDLKNSLPGNFLSSGVSRISGLL